MESETSGLVIDWRLLLLQTVNFLLLLSVLAWLVWKPLIRSIDDRRRAIEEGLKEAEKNKAAAEKAAEEQAKLLGEARKEAEQIRSSAREAIKAETAAGRAAIKQEQEASLKKIDLEIERRKTQLEAELNTSTSNLIIEALKRVLSTTDDDFKRWQGALDRVIKDSAKGER